MHHEDTDSVIALGKSGLTYVDLAASAPSHKDYVPLQIIGGLSYEDLAATDPDSQLAMSFVAEIDNRMIGFLLAYIHFVGIPITKICIIRAIVVDPDYQGQGIGTRLFKQLQNKCREDGIQVTRILVPQHNTQLRNYLSAMGFHQSSVLNYDKLSGDQV